MRYLVSATLGTFLSAAVSAQQLPAPPDLQAVHIPVTFVCGKPEEVFSDLAERYGEGPTHSGQSSRGTVYITQNAESGTFSFVHVVESESDPMACLFWSGNAFHENEGPISFSGRDSKARIPIGSERL